MGKIFILIPALFLIIFCSDKTEQLQIQPEAPVRSEAGTEIKIKLDPVAYRYTSFGEPPQLVVWFENEDQTDFKTIWVTHRSGKNDWKGKIECPVALPFWDSRRELFDQWAVDGCTGATPLNDSLRIPLEKTQNGVWQYFIEVNAAADYNSVFSYWSAKNRPDSEGNGQPSLIYQGVIDFDQKKVSPAELIGRTNQYGFSDSVFADLEGMTSAKNLIREINIIFR